MMVNDIDAGGPIRMGAALATCPQGWLKSSVSMPKFRPKRCSKSVSEPRRVMIDAKIRVIFCETHAGLGTKPRRAITLKIAQIAALGNAEIPLLIQSVRRGRSSTQPSMVRRPAAKT